MWDLKSRHGKTGSKLEKEYIKAIYCNPAYLTYMQSTSCEMPDWVNCKLESRLPEEISITSAIHQPWDFFGRNDAKAETPVLWPPHVKS